MTSSMRLVHEGYGPGRFTVGGANNDLQKSSQHCTRLLCSGLGSRHDSTPTASFEVRKVDLLWPQPPLTCSLHHDSTPGPLSLVVAACVKDARPSRWLAPLATSEMAAVASPEHASSAVSWCRGTANGPAGAAGSHRSASVALQGAARRNHPRPRCGRE